MHVTERTFEEIVLANPGRKLEMYEGQVREKPPMSIGHNRTQANLYLQLAMQLRKTVFEVRMSQAPVRRSARNYYLPDVYVVQRHPRGMQLKTFEEFVDPLPFCQRDLVSFHGRIRHRGKVAGVPRMWRSGDLAAPSLRQGCDGLAAAAGRQL